MKGLMQSDLFDVESICNVNAEIKKKEHERLNLEARKNLSLPYYPEPKNDNEKLFNYQYEYIKNNDSVAWGNLLELSFIVTKRLVWKWMKAEKIILDDIEQDEKTSIAVEYVLRRYTKNIGYCITTNFITALKDGVKHAMKYKTKADYVTDSLEDLCEKGMKI
mgnify:CR=1 FL=1